MSLCFDQITSILNCQIKAVTKASFQPHAHAAIRGYDKRVNLLRRLFRSFAAHF